MMEIEKEFLSGQKNILVVSTGDYHGDILNSVKRLQGKSICYVTLSKTYKALQEDFEKNGIDTKDMIIVDAISKTIKPDQRIEKNSYFVSSPGALTELAIAIRKFLDYGFDYLIFDSLNSLLVYRDAPIVKRWISSMMGNVKESESKAVFYILNLKDQQDLIKEVGMFADKVINLEKVAKRVPAFTGELKK